MESPSRNQSHMMAQDIRPWRWSMQVAHHLWRLPCSGACPSGIATPWRSAASGGVSPPKGTLDQNAQGGLDSNGVWDGKNSVVWLSVRSQERWLLFVVYSVSVPFQSFSTIWALVEIFTGETGNFYAIFFRIPIIQMIGRCSSVLNPDRTWDKNSWRIPFPFFSRKIIRNIMESDENDD